MIEIRLDPGNFAQMCKKEPSHFKAIRFDAYSRCNLRCTYCCTERMRSSLEISLEQFEEFLDQNVLSLSDFQMGCSFEPTIVPQMGDYLLAVRRRFPSLKSVRVQTNGTRLNQHSPDVFQEAGVTELSVSIDSLDPEINAMLRKGSDLQTILDNTALYMRHCPNLRVALIVVVTSVNLAHIEPLVEYAISIGAVRVELREVLGLAPEDPLSLQADDYENLCLRLEPYSKKISFCLNSRSRLKQRNVTMQKSLELLGSAANKQ